MLTSLLLLWPISLALTWLVAQGLANKPFDRALVYNVQALAQLVKLSPDQQSFQFNLPQPASELLRADDADLVYYQVTGPQNELLGGDRDLPQPQEEEKLGSFEVKIRDDEMRGLEVRVAYTWVQLTSEKSPSRTGPVLVQVAETREKRSVLATEIIKGVMLPQFAILPLAVLLVWLALVRGIKPLSELEERIRARKSDDLSPLDEKAVPLEVAPLVSSVNDLLRRLKDSIGTQKRFLADAAHQLKTPLAGLRMQADLAQRKDAGEDELKQSLKQIGRASVQATHTVNQLLSLARAEGGGAIDFQTCDMEALISEVLNDSLPHAMDKGIDLGYDGVDTEKKRKILKLQGNPTLLKEMIRNLVDNSIHYTPRTPESLGIITVRLLVDPYSQAIAVQVEDNGPGVTHNERARIFERFARGSAGRSRSGGTGLGLALVAEHARAHNGLAWVEDSPNGGARFVVEFPEVRS